MEAAAPAFGKPWSCRARCACDSLRPQTRNFLKTKKQNTDLRQFLFFSQSFCPFAVKLSAGCFISLCPFFTGPDQEILNSAIRFFDPLGMPLDQASAASCFRTERSGKPTLRRPRNSFPDLHPSPFHDAFPSGFRQSPASIFQPVSASDFGKVCHIEPFFPKAAPHSGLSPVIIRGNQCI